MIDLKKIVDDWNAMYDANDTLFARFEKLEFDDIRKHYSEDDLINWEKGNKSLKIFGLKELLMKESKIGHATYHILDRHKIMYKDITDPVNLKQAEFAYHCWFKLQSLLILRMKDENLLVKLKNSYQRSKNEFIADALAYVDDQDEIKFSPYLFDTEIGNIDKELLEREKLSNNLLFKIKSNIKKKVWLSILIDLSEHKYIPKTLSDNKNYLITWIKNAFEFEDTKTFDSLSIELLEWKRPVIALAELISKLLTEKIIDASIENNQSIKKIVQWMNIVFDFKPTRDPTLLNYFKAARKKKLQSNCFELKRKGNQITFKVNY